MEIAAIFESWHIGDGNYPPLHRGQRVRLSFELIPQRIEAPHPAAPDTFRRLRAENYELLKELPETAFDRVGAHTENGPLSLRNLLEIYAGHAENHARQLQTIRAEYKKVKGKK